MSQVWNEGYFTDVGYTYGYYREISPVFQRFCLLINGYDAPISDHPVHCELGFGQGVSVNVHAASSPGDYIATDFNPAHATHARSLAAATGRDTRLYDDSFEQFLNRTDLPLFDSISLHGIWTWVSRDNHKIITEFARRNLKPGGILYNSYNCFPGWSAAYPLRQLFALHDRFASTAEDATKRVDTALKFTESLFAAQPGYLKSVVGLEDRLKKIMEQNRNYLAHEYFNREWNCMYFTDVVDALASAKLEFASSANPVDLVDAVNLPLLAQEFLRTIDHPIMREQARDYFINQQFRKDLYLRGAVKLHPAEQRNRLLDTKFILTTQPASVTLSVRGPAGEASLQEDIYRPLLEFLATQKHSPKSLREILQAHSGRQYAQMLQAIIILIGLSVVQPCQPEAHAKAVRKSCDALNNHLLQLGQSSNGVTVLASPLTGSGIPVDRITQLFVLAGHRKSPDPIRFVWDSLRGVGQVLTKEGKALQSEEENLAELRDRNEKLASVMPIMKSLQIA